MAAPRNNKNAQNKRKANPRISLSMGISGELRELFSRYLTGEGIDPTEDNIKQQARSWAYQDWFEHLKQQIDRQETISL